MNLANLKYVQFESYRNETDHFYLYADYRGYGFELNIYNDNGDSVFKKFLRTSDIDYCGNYLRKVVRNNFGAEIW